MDRKLTTILAADVVGYSKMMAANEENTLACLKERRLLIDGIINEYGGTIFGSAGDSLIAQFDSPVRATESAIQFQNKLQGLNENAEINERMVSFIPCKSKPPQPLFRRIAVSYTHLTLPTKA